MKRFNKTDQSGTALVVTILVLVVLSILGTAALTLTNTELLIVRNIKLNAKAFYNAESGIYFTLSQVEEALGNGTQDIYLPATIGSSKNFNSTLINKLSDLNIRFEISSITKKSNKIYSFNSTGRASNNAQEKINAKFTRGSAVNFAVFGDKEVDVGNTAGIYSYNSTVISDPVPSDSTGYADSGSNELVILRNNCVVDGSTVLGKNVNGVQATLDDKGGIVSGTNGMTIDRIDPDPLGLIGGEYADNVSYYSLAINNDNDELSTDPSNSISGSNMVLENGQNATLQGKSGGANYYFNDIKLKNNAVLYINTTNGSVNIYLAGEIDAVTGSNIITKDTDSPGIFGNPRDFSIFASSQDNTNKISIGNDVGFYGFIYAPYISVRMDNSADIFGAIVAQSVYITNSVDIYFDTGMKNEYQSKKIILKSWCEL